MKLSLPSRLATLATLAFASIAFLTPVQAAVFDETDVNQEDFITLAAPFGTGNYNLLVIEQIPGETDCWNTIDSEPTLVEPLLLNFDFTGICRRYADANSYSARVNDQDLGLGYLLRIIESRGRLRLLAVPTLDRSQPEYVIATTNGLANDFLKFELEPGWNLTRRTYNGQTLGHIYFSNDNINRTPEDDLPLAFPDIRNDIYRREINQAVNLGFIAGFDNNTFRPNENLTREQLVSMVVESLITLPNSDINLATSVSARPYPDVDVSRWSAVKVAWARNNNIVSGYPDGTFKPTQPVTRAELIAVQRRAAEYAKNMSGEARQLTATQEAINFSDLNGHWANTLVREMSSYCRVASPLNETGNAFFPDTPARRNYAAAATLRMLNCVKED